MITINTTDSQPHYGLRKLNVGLASVVIGLTLAGVEQAHADSNKNNNEEVTTENTDVQQTYLPPYQAVTPSDPTKQAQTNTAPTNNKSVTNIYNDQKYVQPTPSVPENTQDFVDHYNAQQVKMSQTFIKGLKQVNQGTLTSEQLEAQDPQRHDFYSNDYQSDPYAATEKIDITHLTGKQLLQINLYNNRLVNQIRAQFGSNPYKLNPQEIEHAQTLAYEQQEQGLNGHNLQFLKGDGENLSGLSVGVDQDSPQPGTHTIKANDIKIIIEDNNARAYGLKTTSIKTMDDLQAAVFYLVTNMMFNDAGLEADGHACQFAFNNNDGEVEMGLGFEILSHSDNTKDVLFRWNFSNGYHYDHDLDIDTTPKKLNYQIRTGTFHRQVTINTPTGTRYNQQSVTLTQQKATDLSSGLSEWTNFHGYMPKYQAQSINNYQTIDDHNNKDTEINAPYATDLPTITIDYKSLNVAGNVDDTDTGVIRETINYVLPDGTVAGQSVIKNTLIRTRDNDGDFGNWDLADPIIDTSEGIALKSVSPITQVESSAPGWLEFKQSYSVSQQAIQKIAPGYNVSWSSMTLYYFLPDKHTALSGYCSKYTVEAHLKPTKRSDQNHDEDHYLTIHYASANGDKVATQTIVGTKDKTVSVHLNLPTGYRLANSQDNISNYTFGDSDADMYFMIKNEYAPKPKSIQIIYRSSDGIINRSSTISGEIGETIPLNINIPTGYRLSDPYQNISNYTFTNNSHNYVISLEPKDESFTVYYQTTDGTTVSSQIITGKYNQTLPISLRIPRGFQLSDPSQNMTSYTFTDNNHNQFLQIEPSTQKDVMITLYYQSTDGTLVGSQILTGKPNSRTLVVLEVPTGYQLTDNYQNTVICIFGNRNQNKYIGVEPIPVPAKTLTINYQTDNGTIIDTQKLSGKLGETINVSLNLPDGYHLTDSDNQPTKYTFNYSNPDIYITVAKNSQQTKTITICVHNNDFTFSQSQDITAKIGQTVNVNLGIPQGYKLVHPEQNITKLTMTDQTSPYISIEIEPITNSSKTIYIHYFSTDGIINTKQTISAAIGQTIPVKLQIPAGYTLLDPSQNITQLTMTNLTQDLFMTIAKQDQGSINYQFVDSDRNYQNVGDLITVSGNLNKPLHPNLTIPNNYILANNQSLPTEITLTKAQNGTTFIYLKHKVVNLTNQATHTYRELTVRYIYADGPKTGENAGSDIIRYYGIRYQQKDLVTGKISDGPWHLDINQYNHGYQVIAGKFIYPTDNNRLTTISDISGARDFQGYHLYQAPKAWEKVTTDTNWTDYSQNPLADNPVVINGKSYHNNGNNTNDLQVVYLLRNQVNLKIVYQDEYGNVITTATTSGKSGDSFDITQNIPNHYFLTDGERPIVNLPDLDGIMYIDIMKPRTAVYYKDSDGNTIESEVVDDISQYQPKAPENYELADDDLVINGYPKTLTIHIEPKWDAKIETRTVTRDIKLHMPNGTTQIMPQSVTFMRRVETNEINGQIHYDKWFTIDGNDNFSAYTPQAIAGYTIDTIPAIKINPNDISSAIEIYYEPVF